MEFTVHQIPRSASPGNRLAEKVRPVLSRGCFFLTLTLLCYVMLTMGGAMGLAVDVRPVDAQSTDGPVVQDKEPPPQEKKSDSEKSKSAKTESTAGDKQETSQQESEQDGKSGPGTTGEANSENAGDNSEGSGNAAKTPRDTTPLPIDWSVEGTLDLNFDHLKFNIQPDETFQIRQLTAQLIKLRGHKIRIRGYIKPAFKSTDIQKFVLVRDNQECCFGPGAALYDCMIVNLKPGKTTDYSTRPITVEGTFQLKPFRGEDKRIWAIFSLKDAQVR